MEKNKNVGVNITIIALIILFLLLGGYFIYDKVINVDKGNDNTPPAVDNNAISSNLNQELQDIISFTTKTTDNKSLIIAITETGNSINILDITDYNGGIVYSYYENKLYLYSLKYTSDNDTNTLSYIDLTKGNGNYTLTTLSDITIEGSPNSIAATKDNIYYSSSAEDYVMKYNMVDKSTNVTNISNKQIQAKLYTLNDNVIAYNESANVTVLNTINNEKKVLTTNGSISFVDDEKVVYYEYINNNHDSWKYFEYDYDDGTNKVISEPTTSSVQAINLEFIVPINDGYVYANKNTLYQSKNNTFTKLYTFDAGIESMTLMSRNTIKVTGGSDAFTDANYFELVFNIDSKTVSEQKNNTNYYSCLYIDE